MSGEPNAIAMAGFVIFIALSLVITWFAARRTRRAAMAMALTTHCKLDMVFAFRPGSSRMGCHSIK